MTKYRTPHPSAKGLQLTASKKNIMVRHGASKQVLLDGKRYPIEINSVEAIKNNANKATMKDLLIKAEVCTTDSFENTPENRQKFKDNKWNVVYKMRNHRRGIGMEFLKVEEIDKLAAPQYNGLIERRINVKREWRVHAAPLLNKTYALEKRRRHAAEGPARNLENCVFREEFEKPADWQNAIDLCLKAVQAIGLDTGAVDLAWSGTKYYVIEVNSGPGLGPKSKEWYQATYNELIAEKLKN